MSSDLSHDAHRFKGTNIIMWCPRPFIYYYFLMCVHINTNCDIARPSKKIFTRGISSTFFISIDLGIFITM